MKIFHLSPRRWLAWRLSRLAFRIFDDQFEQEIEIVGPDGEIIATLTDLCSTYGHGVNGWHLSSSDHAIRVWDMEYPDDLLEEPRRTLDFEIP